MADIWTPPSGPAAGVSSRSEMISQRTDNIDVLSRAIDGDASASTIKLRQKVGTWANRPAAGEPGRRYYCTDTGWDLIDDGTLWHVTSHNPKLSDRLYNDFHEPGNSALTANGWIFGWRFTVAAGAAGGDHGSGRDKSCAALIGKTAAGGCAHFTPIGNTELYIPTAGSITYPMIYEVGVRLESNVSVTYHFGLTNGLSTTATPSPASSIMFRYGSAGDADALQYFSVTQHASGGETKNDSGVTPAHSTMDILRIEIDSTSAARFYANGTLFATHAAGIPATDDLAPGFSVRTNTAGNKELRIDYIDLLYKRPI